jgi:hypothetical protein
MFKSVYTLFRSLLPILSLSLYYTMSDFVDFAINNVPIVWGTIMYNTDGGSCYPLCSSQTNLSTLSQNNLDEYWMVMPGFKIAVYAANSYTGTLLVIGDNTYGTSPIVVRPSAVNSANSVQLYFKGSVI